MKEAGKLLFRKSDYKVKPLGATEKVNRGSKSWDILHKIHSHKVCLSSDVVKNTDTKGKQCLDFLTENREIVRLTVEEFYILIPSFITAKYENVVNRANGRRIIVSPMLYSERLNNIFLDEYDNKKYNKFQEIIDAVENNHMFEYRNDQNGFPLKVKINSLF